MRRVLAIAAVAALLALGAAAALAGDGDGEDGGKPTYTLEVDNAFGLVAGSDLKIAGVRAGSITGMKLDRRTRYALLELRIDKNGFGSLRSDVRCTVRPQSLLGEYYVDCLPGRARRELPSGTRIGVEHTTSTVPPDLVVNTMRLPYRERLRLILSELGAGVAANGPRLSAALRRALPAIGETRRVLRALGSQQDALDRLVRDADTVTAALAGNRRDVGRWVREARDTATASAQRERELAAGLERLPAFLQEVTPSMRALGELSARGTPSLRNLAASAEGLDTLLRRGTDVAEAARPAARALGRAADVGRPAVRGARPVVDELRRTTRDLPEVARNAAIITDDLDDRDQAIEAHPLSPGRQGFTPIENVMNYIFNQGLAINVYDAEGHVLKGGVFVNDCSPYADVKAYKEKHLERCRTWVGPNQPGITFPDGSERQAASRDAKRGGTPSGRTPLEDLLDRTGLPAPARSDEPTAPAPARPSRPETPPRIPAPALPELPPLPSVPPLPGAPQAPDARAPLLDFLLGS